MATGAASNVIARVVVRGVGSRILIITIIIAVFTSDIHAEHTLPRDPPLAREVFFEMGTYAKVVTRYDCLPKGR